MQGTVPLATADGAQRALPGGVATAGVLIWNGVDPQGHQAFYCWHNAEHMPERMAIPGFVRARRYADGEHPTQWFTLYEATSLGVLVSEPYLERLNHPTPATQATLQYFRNTARSVCSLRRATGNAVGGHALVLRFDAPQARADLAGAEHLAVRMLQECEAMTGVLSTSLFGADVSASRIDTAESKTRAFDVPQLTIMVEASHRQAVQEVRERFLHQHWQAHGLMPRAEQGLFILEVSLG